MTTLTRASSAKVDGIEQPSPQRDEEKPEEIVNPYIGPRAFENQGRDRELFFGRTRETRELLNLLIAERIVLFYSPSGAGKTSLINAALRPLLEEEEFYVFPVLRLSADASKLSDQNMPANVDPYTQNLLVSLEGALVEELSGRGRTEAETAKISLAAFLEHRKESGARDTGDAGKSILCDYLDYLGRWRKEAGEQKPLVFIFDQFEEVLIIDPHETDEKVAFFNQIGAALRDSSRWALFSMREDHIGQLEPYMRVIPTQLRTTYRLDLLNEKAAREAIQRPAEKANGKFEEDATTYLINDLRTVAVPVADARGDSRKLEQRPGPYIEPVQLQVVCRQLWEEKKKKTSEVKGRRVGTNTEGVTIERADLQGRNVDDALANYYAEQVAAVAKHTRVSERKIREWIEYRLIIEGRGGDARGQVQEGTSTWQELGDETIHALRETHLVRAEHRRGFSWLELAHDRLIEPIRKNNAEWRKSRFQQRLLRFAPVVVPVALLIFLLAVVSLSLIARSLSEQRDKAQSEAIVVQQTATAVAQTVTAVAQTATAVAQTVTARRTRTALDLSRELATQSNALTDQPDLALLLSVEAFLNADTAQARQSLLRELQVPSSYVLGEGKSPVSSVAFSNTLASGMQDGNVILWRNIDAKEQITLTGHLANVLSVAFSPDGKTLASGSTDATIRLWDVNTIETKISATQVITTFGSISSVAFNPQDGRLASSGCVVRDNKLCIVSRVSLWDVSKTSITQTWTEIDKDDIIGAANMIVFSPDGKTLASANQDGSVSLWEVSAGGLVVLNGIPGNVDGNPLIGLAFSPDGNALALAALNSIPVTLLTRPKAGWGAADLPVSYPLTGTCAPLNLAFSADSKMLAWGCRNGDINIADLTTHKLSGQPLQGHPSSVQSLAFNPNGRTLVSGGEDGTIRVWDVVKRPPLDVEHATIQGDIVSAAFAQGGTILASYDGSESITLWDFKSGPPVSQPLPVQEEVTNLAVSPDGMTLAFSSKDNKVLLWDLSAHPPTSRTLPNRDVPVTSLAFSPNSRELLVASEEGAITRWNIIDTPYVTATPFAVFSRIYSMAVNPGDDQFVLGDEHGTLIVRSSGIDEAPSSYTVPVFTSSVSSLAFSPDLTMLAFGSEDGVINLWFLEITRPIIQTLAKLDKPIKSLTFSSESKELISLTNDGSMIHWNVDPEIWRDNLCGIATRNLTSDEWSKWLIAAGKEYRKTCPDIPDIPDIP
jgi:WD40 repeat protein